MYPMIIPESNVRVTILWDMTVFPYPFLMATTDVKYPVRLSIQKKGMANKFTIIGPIIGIDAVRIDIPAKTLVI